MIESDTTAEHDDDDALAWAGDEKTTAPRREPTPVSDDDSLETDVRQIPAPLLVTYGIIAGVFLLYTVGWIITISRSTTTLSSLLGEIMFQLGEFLAIASPAVWFASAFLLTRGRKPIVRLLVLLLGLVATVPWPFLLGV